MKLFRCSSLHKLIGDGCSKAAVISDTAKAAYTLNVDCDENWDDLEDMLFDKYNCGY